MKIQFNQIENLFYNFFSTILTFFLSVLTSVRLVLMLNMLIKKKIEDNSWMMYYKNLSYRAVSILYLEKKMERKTKYFGMVYPINLLIIRQRVFSVRAC